LILAGFQLGNGGQYLGPVPGHGFGMALGIAILHTGHRGFRHHGAYLQIIGFIGQVGVLLVDDAQLVAQHPESFTHLPQSTFDPACAHRRRCYAATGQTAAMSWPHDTPAVDAWGIAAGYHDIEGVWHPTNPDTRQALRDAMGDPTIPPLRWFVEAGDAAPLWNAADLGLADGTVLSGVTSLPPDLPWGWHELHPLDGGPMTELVVHPPRCPDAGRRAGVAVQLHELWSDDTWETGDLTDLAALLQRVAAAGGDTALLSPLHALLPGRDQDPSPYSPSSRRWRHGLLARPPGIRPAGVSADPARLVERSRVWDHAQRALDEAFDAREPGGSDDRRWRAWAARQGDALVRYSQWCVAVERFGVGWHRWPAEFRHPDASGWRTLFRDDGESSRRADRHSWVQWRVAEAMAHCTSTGVGLVTDVAVGFHPDGFDAWELQDVTAGGVSIGAPPDPFSVDGQNWGLPPLIPGRLAEQRYERWLTAFRSAADGAAGVRLDHVMGLFRQFWIPPGGTPADGAYVRFPGDHLMAVLAWEATLADVFVVGEDLGTVEPEVRELMSRRRVLGTRVGWFEPDPRPFTWPQDTMATFTTHDLPTLAGIWTSDDPGDDEFRARLATAAGCSPHDAVPVDEVIDAAHTALLLAPSQVRLVTVDDLCASTQRPNLPGVVGPPSWCARLPVPVESIPLDVLRHGTVTS